MIKYAGKTDIGLYRNTNQDSYLALENSNGDFLALVCDGIGGAKAGDVASGEVVKYMQTAFKKAKAFADIDDAIKYINETLKKANKHVYDLAKKHKEFQGMGTTVTGILITKFGNLSINVGDSRTYGALDLELFRLTKDHTLVNQMLEEGKITYEESLNHPQKHYLVRAVGVIDDVEFDIHEVKDMEYYLLCSDGLCGYVDDKEIISVLNDPTLKTPEEKCDGLINLGLIKGGYDNITVVVVNKYEDR